MFNDAGIADDPSITWEIFQDRLARQASWLPPGSRSQMIRFFDRDGNRIAVAHQYVLPDGTRRGRPDPKMVELHGVRYTILSDEVQ